MKYTLTVKQLKTSCTLVDSRGVYHGIFATEIDALKVKAQVEENLERFYGHGRLIYLKPKRKKKFNRRRNHQRSKPS